MNYHYCKYLPASNRNRNIFPCLSPIVGKERQGYSNPVGVRLHLGIGEVEWILKRKTRKTGIRCVPLRSNTLSQELKPKLSY